MAKPFWTQRKDGVWIKMNAPDHATPEEIAAHWALAKKMRPDLLYTPEERMKNAEEQGDLAQRHLEASRPGGLRDLILRGPGAGGENLKDIAKTTASGIGPALKEDITGFGKEALKRVGDIGDFFIGGQGPRYGHAMVKSPGSQGPDPHLVPESVTRLNTLGERAGAGIEQGFEFAVPESVLAKGSKAVDAFLAARKLPALVTKVGSLLGKSALEGASAGAITALQGGDAKTAAGIGAAGPVIGAAAERLGPALKRRAIKQVEKDILKPSGLEAKAVAKRVAPELLEQGMLVSGSQRSLAEKAAAKTEAAGESLAAAYKNLPANASVSKQRLLQAMEVAKDEYRTGLGSRMKGPVKGFTVDVDPVAIRKMDSLMGIINKYGDRVSVQDLRETRQIWDAIIGHSGGFNKALAPGARLDVTERAANSIREELNSAFPDIGRLNAKYSFWRDVKDLTGSAAEKHSGLTLGEMAGSLAAAGGGAFHKGPIEGAAAGIAFAAIAKFAKSTAWNTFSATRKDRLAKLLASGRFYDAVRTLQSLGNVTLTGIPKMPSTRSE